MRSLHYYVVQVAYKAAQLLPAPVTHAPKKKKKASGDARGIMGIVVYKHIPSYGP